MLNTLKTAAIAALLAFRRWAQCRLMPTAYT